MSHQFDTPESIMRHALKLAARGEGHVEPNPMVGAVVVDDELRLLGAGYHQQFGGPHAEIQALRQAGEHARGATLYVTLEPCCHHGKTPPCTAAVLAAGIKRVVVAARDPFPAVAGQGIETLRAAGVMVETGLLEAEAIHLTAPFRTLTQQQRPFVIAKWAMSLDGKLAAHTGISKWISNAASRAIVHQIRGRMDGILVGIGTTLADDPLLTARPIPVGWVEGIPETHQQSPTKPEPHGGSREYALTHPTAVRREPRSPTVPAIARIATRIVLDSHARLPLTSQLVQTAREIPVLVFATPAAPSDRVSALRAAGVEVVVVEPDPHQHPDLEQCLQVLGQRRMTNILVEGGSAVLGNFFDRQLIDEVHVFVAPILIGGEDAASPVGGMGLASPELCAPLAGLKIEQIEGDVHVSGRLIRMNRAN